MKLKDFDFSQESYYVVYFMLNDKKVLIITRYGDNFKYEILDRKLNTIKTSHYTTFYDLMTVLNFNINVFKIPSLRYAANYDKMFKQFRGRVQS